MEEQLTIGTNCLNGTNLDKAYLIFKEWKNPGEVKETFVPIKDILEKHRINEGAELVGVRVPYKDSNPDVVKTYDGAPDEYAGRTDFILQWYRLSNLLWRINRLLEASVVNEKQKKALSSLITSEFFHMKEEYENSVKNYL